MAQFVKNPDGNANDNIKEALQLRLQLAKSSVKKYQAMQNAVCTNGRAHGMFQFYGANRSGRWAVRLIQLQNLPQNHMSDLAKARELVRTGDYDTMQLLYDDIPNTLSQLSGILFMKLPSGRCLSYVNPCIGENRFGGESVTYEGISTTKKWERIESYGPKFVENIVQAVSHYLLCFAMRNLSNQQICGHVHDELIIECPEDTDVSSITSVMGRSPDWMPDILISGDGYATPWYKKA